MYMYVLTRNAGVTFVSKAAREKKETPASLQPVCIPFELTTRANNPSSSHPEKVGGEVPGHNREPTLA